MSTTRPSPEARAVFDRLSAINRDKPVLDKAAVEAALRLHLEVAGLAVRPVYWAGDAAEAYEAMRARRWSLDAAWEDVEFKSLMDPREPLFQQWTHGADQRASVLGTWVNFTAGQAAMKFPEVLVHQEAARETLAERAPRAYLRGASLCAVLAAAWKPELRLWRRVWKPLIEACEQGLWAFAVLAKEVIAVPRPIIRTDEEGFRLHCETGPAVEWAASRWWMLEGQRVPRHVVLDPAQISIQEVLHEENAAIRRIVIRRMGYGRFLDIYGARPLHEDRFGALFRIRFVEGEDLLVVKVRNSTPEKDGSHCEHFLGVPPYLQTAHEAVAWTFGLLAHEYTPTVET